MPQKSIKKFLCWSWWIDMNRRDPATLQAWCCKRIPFYNLYQFVWFEAPDSPSQNFNFFATRCLYWCQSLMVCIRLKQGRRGALWLSGKSTRQFFGSWQPSMLEYPANSAGDLFRLLPFEGYVGVLAFLPVRWLQKAAQLSRGWQFAVRSVATAMKCDSSITCKSIGDLTNFLTSLRRLQFVSAICCDVVALSPNTSGQNFDVAYDGAKSVSQILQVTWRCACFWDYHASFIRWTPSHTSSRSNLKWLGTAALMESIRSLPVSRRLRSIP